MRECDRSQERELEDEVEEEEDGKLTDGERIPSLKLHLRHEGAQDGEGHLRRRSSRSYESQVRSDTFRKQKTSRSNPNF